MTYQYVKHFKKPTLTVIEQSQEWKDVFCSGKDPDLSEMIKVVPIKKTGKWKWERRIDHDGLLPVVEGKKYDFILIDGPWGSPRNARRDVLSVIEADLLSDDFIIIQDDYDRKGEQDTHKKIKLLLESKGIPYKVGFYKGEYPTAIICSPKYKFLLTL